MAVTATLALTGCAAFSDTATPTRDDGEIDVSTAFYPLQYAAARGWPRVGPG